MVDKFWPSHTLCRVSFDFSQFAAVLLDLDGTLYREEHALPGAVALVRRLQQEHRIIACVSNSTESPQGVVDRLHRMEIEIPTELICTASDAAARYCLQRFAPRPRIMNLSTQSVHEMLEGLVQWVDAETEECDVVLVGNPRCERATLERLRIGMRLIREGAICMGICADRAYPSPEGLEIGSGAMTHMLAYAAGVQPIFFGKPQKIFFQGLCDRLGVAPQDCVLVGDNLESDIGGAKGMGMKTILSLTGVATRKDLEGASPDQIPEWVVENLEELV